MLRKIQGVVVFITLAVMGAVAHGQSARIQGGVSDATGAVIPKAIVRVVDQQTGVEIRALTNGAGQYMVAGLTPGQYKIFVEATGFSPAESDTITLNVGQNALLDFALKIGATEEVVVSGSSANINTTDATVSTVVDREFVEDIPLNGRSFETLILLAPGVVTASPQGGDAGNFSVNGERTNSNYFMVDGVSANNAAGDTSGSGSAGMASNASAIGTTQAILPVDALQEFRISTSSYTPEFGRQPGGQMSFESRSGTNDFHGDVYDYLRNTVFDANNWFNTYTTPVIPRSTEQQNDFGGGFGGPITIPGLFRGRDRAFFFAAYEGLRLNMPTAASIFYVPSNGTYNTATNYANAKYKNERANVTGPNASILQSVLNAFPMPNCSIYQNQQCVDYGDGLSPYLFSGTSPTRINAYFIRADIQVTPHHHVFARYNDTPSNSLVYYGSGPNMTNKSVRMTAYMLGADSIIRSRITNELRLQYSPSNYVVTDIPYSWDGAVPFNLATAQGLPAVGGDQLFEVTDTANGNIGKYYTAHFGSRQFQPNAVDIVSWTHGNHLFKAGVDYRQTTTYLEDGSIARVPATTYIYRTAAQILSNNAYEVEFYNSLRQDPTTKNLGLHFQDTWRVHPRLTLNLGLRWDLNPPPSISGAQMYTFTGDVNKPSTLALSKLGAPIYRTVYTDFQPRVGVALMIRQDSGHEMVLRAGGGLFYDTVALSAGIGSDYGLGASSRVILENANVVPFPATAAEVLAVPAVAPPYNFTYLADPHIVPPSSVHWNVSLEQGLGKRQSMTLAYVGSAGMNLIVEHDYKPQTLDPNSDFSNINEYQNGPGSSYNAMQVKFRRRARQLQVQASYVWAHALDWNSSDSSIYPLQHGNSNHDIRQNFNVAAIYKISSAFHNRVARYITSDWNLAAIEVSRTAFPVTPSGPTVTNPITGDDVPSELNYNGKYPYVKISKIPGGRQFNASAFSVPTTGQYGVGSAPRNFLRGFDENAADVSIERVFPVREQLRLEFRGEAFNITNHPNFGALNLQCGTSTAGAVCNNSMMGQATNELSDAVSGVASIYQQGGPRSLQFALKLQF